MENDHYLHMGQDGETRTVRANNDGDTEWLESIPVKPSDDPAVAERQKPHRLGVRWNLMQGPARKQGKE